MAKVKLLTDTDVLIDYLNHRLFCEVFEGKGIEVYYSIITRKELLSKEGLSATERWMILSVLKRFRLIPLGQSILEKYSFLRREYPAIEKEDCLIAATALVKGLLLFTRNFKHYKIFKGLKFYS